MVHFEPFVQLLSVRPRLTRALRIVAWLFIVSGIVTAGDVIVSVSNDKSSINLGVWNLFVGIGLLRLQPHWRRWAVVLLWLGLIGAGLQTVGCLWASRPDIYLIGLTVRQLPAGMALMLSAAEFGLICWQLKVLRRPRVQELFDWQAYRTVYTGRRLVDTHRFAISIIVLMLAGEVIWFAARTTHGQAYVVVDETFAVEDRPYCDKVNQRLGSFLLSRGFSRTRRPERITSAFVLHKWTDEAPEIWYASPDHSGQPFVQITRGKKSTPAIEVSVWNDVTGFRSDVEAADAKLDRLCAELQIWWRQYQADHPLHGQLVIRPSGSSS